MQQEQAVALVRTRDGDFFVHLQHEPQCTFADEGELDIDDCQGCYLMGLLDRVVQVGRSVRVTSMKILEVISER